MPSIFVQTFAAQFFFSSVSLSGVSLFTLTFKLQMKLTFITSNLYISIYLFIYYMLQKAYSDKTLLQIIFCVFTGEVLQHHSLYSCRMRITLEWHEQETSEASVCLMNRLLSVPPKMWNAAHICWLMWRKRNRWSMCTWQTCRSKTKRTIQKRATAGLQGDRSFIYQWESPEIPLYDIITTLQSPHVVVAILLNAYYCDMHHSFLAKSHLCCADPPHQTVRT